MYVCMYVLYVCIYNYQKLRMYVFQIPAGLKMAATYTRLFSAMISFRTESNEIVFGIASAMVLILECMYVCMYVFYVMHVYIHDTCIKLCIK